MRPLRCLLGIHRWQLLYEPPGPHSGRYRKGVWCVLCAKEFRGSRVVEYGLALLVAFLWAYLSTLEVGSR